MQSAQLCVDKGQRYVCPLYELCSAPGCCCKSLANPSRKSDKEKSFCKVSLGTFFEVSPPAVVLPNAQACKWLNRHQFRGDFISMKRSGLLFLTDSPSHTPLSPHRASSHFWLSGDSERLLFRKNTTPCSLTPHPCCLSAPH